MTTLLRTRVDPRRKAKAEKILKRYGVGLGDAVNMLLAKVEEVDGLPFDLRPNSGPSLLSTAEQGKAWEAKLGAY
jgi:addiction module RelB/DinJ family antitoxin